MSTETTKTGGDMALRARLALRAWDYLCELDAVQPQCSLNDAIRRCYDLVPLWLNAEREPRSTDAERWRFFREHWGQFVFVTGMRNGEKRCVEVQFATGLSAGNPESFDAAIDKLRSHR